MAKKATSHESTSGRGVPTWLMVVGVCFVSACAAVIAAAGVIGVLFFFFMPSDAKMNDDALVQVKPDDENARPKEKSKPPNDGPLEVELPEAPVAPPVKTPVTPVIPPASDAFVPLFNGKDLSGWKAGEGVMPFRVEDGNLVGVGVLPKGPVAGSTAAVSEKRIAQDFHLRMEARLGDKGTFYLRFRCPPDSPNGYRLTMLAAKNGARTPTLGSVATGKIKSFPGGKASTIRTDEWFTIEIIARGNRLELKVNGMTTVDVVDNDLIAPGHLRVYYLGDCNVAIRKLEIKELGAAPAPPIAPVDVPAPADGFVSLFNGKDLSGWKTHSKQPGNWRVKDGILTGSGPSASALYTLRDDYRDFHLRVEAHVNDKGAGAVFARSGFGPVNPSNVTPRMPLGYRASINNTATGPKTGKLYVVRDTGASGGGIEATARSGEWSTIELIANKSMLRLIVDGRETRSYNDIKSLYPSGHIALYVDNPACVLEFRRIEIMEK